MQGQAIARTLREHLFCDGYRILGHALRLVRAAEGHERLDPPCVRLGIVGRHAEIAQVARTQIRGELRRLLERMGRVLEARAAQLLEAHPNQHLDIGAPCKNRRIRSLHKRLQQGGRVLGVDQGVRVVEEFHDLRLRGVGERQRDRVRLGIIAGLAALLEQAHGLGGGGLRRSGIAQHALGAGVMHHGERAIADRIRALEGFGQAVEVIDLALGKLRHHVEPPEALEFAHEIVREVTQQVFGAGARLHRLELGAVGPLRA